MTKCENCGHEFHNLSLRTTCPKCSQPFQVNQANAQDDNFDAAGFAIGMATGVPLSPTHGVSVGSMLGAALHSEPTRAEPIQNEATPSRGGDFGGGGSSSSYDSGSSSSDSSPSSSDSGSASSSGSSE